MLQLVVGNLSLNSAGKAVQRVNLNVYEKPTISPGLSEVIALLHETVKFNCISDGVPEPTVSNKSVLHKNIICSSEFTICLFYHRLHGGKTVRRSHQKVRANTGLRGTVSKLQMYFLMTVANTCA